jgi:SulP family sulfate permease
MEAVAATADETVAATPQRPGLATGRTIQLVAAIAVLSTVSLAYNLAFAAIIYRGELADALPIGLGINLMAQLVAGVFVAVRSSLRGHFVGPQDTPAIVLAPAAASLAGLGAAAVPTVITLIVLSTAAVGIVLYALGRLGLGGMLRYLPFPVVAGFLAGLGLVLIVSAFDAGIGDDGWSDARAVWRWLPALALGSAMVLAGRWWPNRSIIIPLLTLGSMPVAHVMLWIAGLDQAEAQSRGLLLGPYESGLLWRPSEVWRFAEVDWGALAAEIPMVAPVLILYPVSILMNLAGLEHQTGADIDGDRGLQANGLANLLSIPFGASAVGTQLGESTLSFKLVGASRIVAAATAVINGAVVVVGASLLGLIPSVVVQGVVFYLGIGFVVDWLWNTRNRFSPVEFALVVAVAASIFFFGFSIGVAVGIGVAVLLFVVRYSRIGAIRHQLTSRERRSNMEWGERADALLDDRGDRSLILELYGFVFFGSAARLLEPLADRLAADSDIPGDHPLEVIVIDFHRVVGIDSDAALSFDRLVAMAEACDVAVVMCGLDDGDRQRLWVGPDSSLDGRVHFEDDLDRALQWCEAHLLGDDADQPPGGFESWLARELNDPALAARLADRWEQHEAEAGTVLVSQGDPGQGLLAIETGMVSVFREAANGAGRSNRRRRIRTLRPVTLIGEMSLYTGRPASATVEADIDVTYRRLSSEAFEQLSADEPELALALHRMLGRVLVERVAHGDSLIEAILG